MIVLSAQEAAQLDRQAQSLGVPEAALVEAAGFQLACRVASLTKRKASVGMLCGKGNNAADALAAARYLVAWDRAITLVLAQPQEALEPLAAGLCRAAVASGAQCVDAEELEEGAIDALFEAQDLLVDALLGSGARPGLRPSYRRLVEMANRQRAIRLAVDLPTGVDATTGQIADTAFAADSTLAMGTLKLGHLLPPGSDMTGELWVAPIPFPRQAYAPSYLVQMPSAHQLAAYLHPYRRSAHKGELGRVLILAGSLRYSGAAVLAAQGALRAGAGLVTVAVPTAIAASVRARLREAMVLGVGGPRAEEFDDAAVTEALAALRPDVIAFGPGMGRTEGVRHAAESLLEQWAGPLVIDADGLVALQGHLSPLQQRQAPVILTPHPGEAALLLETTGEAVNQDRLQAARTLAQQSGQVALLKGAYTVIAAADGRIRLNGTGNPGMASGGMGDTLTGILATFLAQGMEGFAAAQVAAFAHGRAADRICAQRGERGLLASEVADALPDTLQEIARAQPSERWAEPAPLADLLFSRAARP